MTNKGPVTRILGRTLILGSMVFGLAGQSAAETLKLATVATENSVWVRQINRFVDAVHAADSGLEIAVYPNAELGDESNTFRNMMMGRVDLWFGGIVAPTTVVPELGALSLPYVFDDAKAVPCIIPRLEPHIRDAISDRFQMLFFGYVGEQGLFGGAPIRTPSDLQGRKTRSAQLQASIEFFKAAGASPNPINSVETVSALNLGMVEVADFPVIYATLVGVHKTAPYFSPTDHRTNLSMMVVGKKTWARLSDDQREALQAAAATTSFAENWAEVSKANQDNLVKAQTEGLVPLELSEEERKAWVAAGRSIWDDVIPDMPAEVGAFLSVMDAEMQQCR